MPTTRNNLTWLHRRLWTVMTCSYCATNLPANAHVALCAQGCHPEERLSIVRLLADVHTDHPEAVKATIFPNSPAATSSTAIAPNIEHKARSKVVMLPLR
jgi:hypothetical protein